MSIRNKLEYKKTDIHVEGSLKYDVRGQIIRLKLQNNHLVIYCTARMEHNYGNARMCVILELYVVLCL